MKSLLALLLSALLAFPAATLPQTVAPPARSDTAPPPPAPQPPLRQQLNQGYNELFQRALQFSYAETEIKAQRQALETGKNVCVNRFKNEAKRLEQQINQAQSELKKNSATLSPEQRTAAHCRIQNLDLLRSEAQVLANHAIPTAYDNLQAKLELIQKWPAQHRQMEAEFNSGAYAQRQYGDARDIGFRNIASGQADDIKTGREALEEMRRAGILPPRLDNQAIQDYVNTVAQNIARNSDLKVPLHVEVLQSREINAFALPGGYLFVERGLLQAAGDESELAGVLAHEIAHDTARHAHKLMKRATIAGIFYQAAQIAALVLTGGAAGLGTAYALQYGFYGLGMLLNLNLLGVSRDSELEADRLGVQYAWKAGYDPSGFVRFFDKMATREGYVNGVSWFRTHPPFYQRMVDSEREILFLPPQPQMIVQTTAFERMQRELAPIAAAQQRAEAGAPSLRMTREEGCAPPKTLEYKPGQPVEELCAQPLAAGGR